MRHNNRDRARIELNSTRDNSNKEQSKIPAGPSITSNPPMKLIPWADIWMSLKVARIRGNGEMIEVFYDTLFKEAVFDDNGAWAIDLKNRP